MPTSKQSLRLLYIEDNPDDVELTLAILRRSGFDPHLIVARDQTEFEVAFQSERFDVILSDYFLPDTNGLAILQQIRKEGSLLPFILVTGEGREDIADEAVSLGADDYVIKQYLRQQLPKAVKNALARVEREKERQQLLQALQESESRYRSLVESTPEGIIVVQKNRLVFANPAFLHMVQLPTLEAVAALPLSKFFGQNAPVEAEQQGKQEVVVQKQDGTPIWVEIVRTPIIWRGQPATLLHIQDISERHAREEERQQMNRKLQETNTELQASLLSLEKTKNELTEALKFNESILQNVSHELRTPLTHIKGYTEVLLEELFGPLNQEQVSALAIINKQADILNRQVNQLLAVQTFSMEGLDRQPVDLGTLLQGVVQEFQPVVQKQGMRFDTQIPETDILYCLGDEERLRESLNNIFDNAIKFSPDGGTIHVSIANKGDYFLLSIKDEGIGIPQEKIERIFDRFYQADSGMNRMFRGFGIGLAIAKQVIEGHEGRIWAESSGIPHEGTTIRIMLPALKEIR